MPSVSRGTYSWFSKGGPVLEDFADRLNHVWTCGLLLLLACIISWKQQMFNNPISCWTPQEFTEAMVLYTHTTCWRSNGMLFEFVPVDYDIPKQSIQRGRIHTYKWLPLVLCVQAILFKFPTIFMNSFHGFSGVSFEKIIGLTSGYKTLNLEERAVLGKQIGRYMYNWCTRWGQWRPLSISWLLTKILFLSNALVQFILTDKFLATETPGPDKSRPYGATLFSNIFNRNPEGWEEPEIFPRTVLCDFKIRQLRHVNDFTVQCDLPINETQEYVYMFIWIWLLITVVVSFLSLVVFMAQTLVPIFKQRYISHMLQLSDEPNTINAQDSSKVASLVGEDGVLILKLMSANSSELFVRDVVFTLSHLAGRQPPYIYSPVTTQSCAAGTTQAPEQEQAGPVYTPPKE